MKIGMSLGISAREPISHNTEVIQNAETLGFDTAYVADCQLSMKDPFTAMTLAAINTSTIKLGTGVTQPVTRHPTTLACQFTALQEISQGRAIIGMGCGWTAPYSVGLKPAKIKYLEEAINNIHTLCEGGEVEGPDGEPYHMPIATGRIPIYIAANQPRILQMSGRVADGLILMGGANEDFIQWQIDHVRRGAEEAGRNFDEIHLELWANIGMSEDRAQARDDVSHWATSQAETFDKWKELPDFLLPFKQDFENAGKAYDRHEHMSSHAQHKTAISPEFIDFVALVGTVEECLERIQKLQKAGLHGITLAFRAGAGGRQARMEEISRGIIKYLK